MASTSPKPVITAVPVCLFERRYVTIQRGLNQSHGPHVLPAPAALHADIASTGAALNVTTGFTAVPSPSRPPRLTLAGMGSVAGKVTLYGKRFGFDIVQTINISGAGDFDGVIACDEYTRLTSDKDLVGTLTLKTGLGWGLPNAIDEIVEVAIDGVRITPDVDWMTGTIRLTAGQIPDGTKKYSAVYKPRFDVP